MGNLSFPPGSLSVFYHLLSGHLVPSLPTCAVLSSIRSSSRKITPFPFMSPRPTWAVRQTQLPQLPKALSLMSAFIFLASHWFPGQVANALWPQWRPCFLTRPGQCIYLPPELCVKGRQKWNHTLPLNNIICVRNSQNFFFDFDDRKTQTIIIQQTALLGKCLLE